MGVKCRSKLFDRYAYQGERERGRVRLGRQGPNEWSREARGVVEPGWPVSGEKKENGKKKKTGKERHPRSGSVALVVEVS